MHLLKTMEAAAGRLRQLQGIFGQSLKFSKQENPHSILQIRLLSDSSNAAGGKKISIGDVNKLVIEAKYPELVPKKYLKDKQTQSILRHLRWIMQKDILGQDVFLIGPPGPLKRQVALMYLQLTKREMEYVSLSRDTTESDLKQRREIENGTAHYIDQCAVRAALGGRVLVLEGIEKAERNVLPVLNNLLENREMQLDDGRFLMAADRYDKLLNDHTQEELDNLRLVRVSKDFRVIALGLPVPRYQGNPLDPPLRSRFQARDINPTPFKELLTELQTCAPNVPLERLSHIASFATAMLQKESSSMGLPDFPIDNLKHIVKILGTSPHTSDAELLQRLYPYSVMLGKEGRTAVEGVLKKFEISLSESRQPVQLSSVGKTEATASVNLKHDRGTVSFEVPAGSLSAGPPGSGGFVDTPTQGSVLAQMMQSHMTKDFCLIGPRGSGKSVVVQQFANMLGYKVEPIMLYQDMTSRDLLQQRTTLTNGDTVWRPTPLVTAALEGSLAVLDGVHRVNAGSFSVLHRLVSERELQLFDGTRLMGMDKYQALREETGLTDGEMGDRKIQAIHPSFRVVALGEPPVAGSAKQQWLSPEMLTMFLYHHLRPLTRAEEMGVVTALVPNVPDLSKLFNFVHNLRESTDGTLQSLASSLSTRQLLRIARRMAQFPSEDLHTVIHKACMARFLPRLAQSALAQAAEAADICPPGGSVATDYHKAITCSVHEGVVTIGDTSLPVYNPENKTKVPDILFYENPQHLLVMEDMLRDFYLGQHLLLVGNQGVGKNKIVDRFLQMLNRPREYIQLHRDTTVQTLTLQPTVREGIIIYEDSPLVVAVKGGQVLVVDEADKAPTNVTCILKTLVESGEMHLADGRRIVHANSPLAPSPTVIKAHPDFRMVVLANRPGFPFLGNDFFGAMGDIFSCHAIDNPDTESELAMLRQYGPGVPDATLKRLVSAFSDLRGMADQGLINYPYSTREVVNMVRHLQLYPNEGLPTVVRNVFDFDSYNPELQQTIVETLTKHGIPLGVSAAHIHLAKELDMPDFKRVGTWSIADQGMRTRTRLMSLPVTTHAVSVKKGLPGRVFDYLTKGASGNTNLLQGPVQLGVETKPLGRVESRAARFSEEEVYAQIPLEEANIVSDLAVSRASQRSPGRAGQDVIHVATCHPICLYSMTPDSQKVNLIDLYDVFPSTIGSYRPQVKLQPLASPLDDTVLLHEQVTNVLIAVNTDSGQITRLMTEGLPEVAASTRRFTTSAPKNNNPYRMVLSEHNDPTGTTVFYTINGQQMELLNVLEGVSHSVSLPLNIGACHAISNTSWCVTEADTSRKYVVDRKGDEEFVLRPITEEEGYSSPQLLHLAPLPLTDDKLSAALSQGSSAQGQGSSAQGQGSTSGQGQGSSDQGQGSDAKVVEEKISCPNRLSVLSDTYAAVLVGFPELEKCEVHVAPRAPLPETSVKGPSDQFYNMRSKPPSLNKERTMAYLPDSGQIVRALPTWQVPQDAKVEGARDADLSGYLEVSDVAQHKLRYVPVPGPQQISPYASWLFNTADCNVFIATGSDDALVSVDIGGCVRQWETSVVKLDQSLREWRAMLGFEDGRELQLNEEKASGRDDHLTADPKHGKEDEENKPHSGGNTWAGGTGGSSTAGLGGFGGPYRLDAGHKVQQVPQWEKDAVPDHIKQAAREMGLKAWKERLREIQMSEYDAGLYERYSHKVARQVQSLRVMMDSLQAKGKERQWLKHQSYGELDDAKLIDGLVGEANVYKKRGEREPEMGTPQDKPKRLRLLVDVSGSMYRFDGHDSRMTRQMETVLMLMEAFDKYEDKLKYDIYGHSGETYLEEFVKLDNPPKNNKERLIVLKNMLAHSQFCISGDHTLEAAKHHISAISKEDADEHFVILLSDANFDRYGIRPARFGQILTSDEDVNAYAIFIGSLGDQAVRLNKALPQGHSSVCMDTTELPQVMQQIFTSMNLGQ